MESPDAELHMGMLKAFMDLPSKSKAMPVYTETYDDKRITQLIMDDLLKQGYKDVQITFPVPGTNIMTVVANHKGDPEETDFLGIVRYFENYFEKVEITNHDLDNHKWCTEHGMWMRDAKNLVQAYVEGAKGLPLSVRYIKDIYEHAVKMYYSDKEHNKRLQNPEYAEFMRLKAIYEPHQHTTDAILDAVSSMSHSGTMTEASVSGFKQAVNEIANDWAGSYEKISAGADKIVATQPDFNLQDRGNHAGEGNKSYAEMNQENLDPKTQTFPSAFP
jgi:hypothetical protein